MPGEITKDINKKDRRINLFCLEIKCCTAVLKIIWGAKVVFGAYNNALYEISLSESWDIRGLFCTDLSLKDLKRQSLQFSLSNLIRFYLELD